MSAVAITTCEVQVSAADSQTVPTVVTGVSKPLCCRLTLTFYTDQWEPIVRYHSITFTFTGPYTTLQPTLLTSLTPTTVVQGVDNHRWGLYCRRCYCIHVCWRCSSRIVHFSRWLDQLSTVLTNDESPHTGYTFTPWVVSFTPPSIEH